MLGFPPIYLFTVINALFMFVMFYYCYSLRREFLEELDVAKRDFYSINPQARLEKMHLVFFHLHQKGELFRNGISDDWQKWDRDIQAALREYCSEPAIDIYLCNTGRHAPGTEFQSLSKEQFEWAVGFIGEQLKINFVRHRIR